MGLFDRLKKKKKEKPKIDFENYQMRLSIKSICMFEKLTGRSFYSFSDDDVLTLMYCVFITSNGLDMKQGTFDFLIEDERIMKWMAEKFKSILDYIGQFQNNDEESTEEEGEKKAPPKISELVSSLIVEYGVDAHYVMEEMELWQIEPLYEAAEEMVQRRYEEERLWTYMTILPHVDGKKLNKPEKLLPFPWEKEAKKKKVEENLKNNEFAVKTLIGKELPWLKGN